MLLMLLAGCLTYRAPKHRCCNVHNELAYNDAAQGPPSQPPTKRKLVALKKHAKLLRKLERRGCPMTGHRPFSELAKNLTHSVVDHIESLPCGDHDARRAGSQPAGGGPA